MEERVVLPEINREMHFYSWGTERVSSPSTLYLAIHGLMMHGRSFERLAQRLASDGAVVVAPDIRGFGKHYFQEGSGRQPREVDYKGSLEDLGALMKLLKERYCGPETSFVCLGESLGAHMARRLATMYPDLISALILSSPCIRPRMVSLPLIPHALTSLIQIGINPRQEIDLAPFARRFLRDEPESLEAFLADPMNRKSLEVSELLKSVLVVNACQLMSISPAVPVLVLRGEKDCVCKAASTKKFLESLRTDRIVVKEISGSGHLLLQGGEPKEEVVDAITSFVRNN